MEIKQFIRRYGLKLSQGFAALFAAYAVFSHLSVNTSDLNLTNTTQETRKTESFKTVEQKLKQGSNSLNYARIIQAGKLLELKDGLYYRTPDHVCLASNKLSIRSASNSDGFLLGMFQASGSRFFNLFRIDEEGNKLWEKPLLGNSKKRFKGLALTGDGGAILMGSARKGDKYNLQVSRLNHDGKYLWQKTYKREYNNSLNTPVEMADGGIMLIGTRVSTSVSKSSEKVIRVRHIDLIRLNSKGNILWEKTLVGNGFSKLTKVMSTPNGDLLIAGYSFSNGDEKGDAYLMRLDSEGNKLWENNYGKKGHDFVGSLALASNGDILLGGHTFLSEKPYASAYENAHMYLIRLDGEGMQIFEKTYGAKRGSIRDIAVHPEKGAMLIGKEIVDKKDDHIIDRIKLINIDNNGDVIWDQTYSGLNRCYPTLLLTSNEDIIIGQGKYITSIGENTAKAYVMRVDMAGKKIWEKTYQTSFSRPLPVPQKALSELPSKHGQ